MLNEIIPHSWKRFSIDAVSCRYENLDGNIQTSYNLFYFPLKVRRFCFAIRNAALISEKRYFKIIQIL